MNINRSGLWEWAIVVAGSLLVGWLFIEKGPEILTGAFAGILLFIVVFKLKESHLPLLLILTLALGSAYRTDVAFKSFYLRFFVLGVIAFRGGLLWLKSKKENTALTLHRFTFIHGFLFILSVWALISALYSVSPATTALRACSFLLMYFVLFLYLWMRTSTPAECEQYGITLWRSLLIILGLGTLFWMAGVPGMYRDGRLRLVLMNPNTLGHYCALLAPILTWYLFDKAAGKLRVVSMGLAIVMVLALVMSGSRGALGATFAAVLLQCTLCYRKRLLAAGVIGAFLFSVHFLFDSGPPSVVPDAGFLTETVLRGDTLMTGSGRREIWEAAWMLISKKPYIGYGFGTVDKLFQLGYFPFVLEFQGGHVHNSYLQELVNLGWLGSSPIFLSMLIVLFMGVATVLRASRITANYRFSVALYCVVIAGLISGITESWFTSVGSVFCFPFWLCAMLFVKMVRNFDDWHVARA